MSANNKKKNTTAITQIALFTAVLCIISPFAVTFPFSPVPISLATLMLYISVYVLGTKEAVIGCGIYLLIGCMGLPVFSGFTGGIGRVLGATGGYLLGYLFLVWMSGLFVEKYSLDKGRFFTADRHKRNKWNKYICFFIQGLGMGLGTGLCYLLGSFWLSYQAGLELRMAFLIGVLPFIPGDIIKIAAGVFIGNAVRKRLIKVGIIQ